MRIAKWVGIVLVSGLVLLFALVGFLTTFRGTPVSAMRDLGTRRATPTFADPTHRQVVALLTGLNFTTGNTIETLLNGDETFPRLWTDIRAARRSITLRLYYMTPGTVAETLREVISERARAGVTVLFLYDAEGSSFREGYLEELRDAGVRVAEFRPIQWHDLHRAQNRSHVRAVVIDGRIGYTGGFAIDDRWLGGGRAPEEWRETNVRFEGPTVSQLQGAFATGWAEATGTLLTGPLFFLPTTADSLGGPSAALLFTSPTLGSTEAERFLALSIGSAVRSVHITNSYFVPDDDMRGFLVAAARRGVDVRVLTAGRQTDMPIARMAGRRNYAELLASGVRIYEYRPSMIHAKTMVVDGVWASVGTMNFDNRSAALNEESNLVMFDPAMSARLDSIFQVDLTLARELTLETFTDRGWIDRVLEVGASTLSRIL